jgi:hypothetical protein
MALQSRVRVDQAGAQPAPGGTGGSVWLESLGGRADGVTLSAGNGAPTPVALGAIPVTERYAGADRSDLLGRMSRHEPGGTGPVRCAVVADSESALEALRRSAVDRLQRGEVPAGEQPFFTIPVFNWHAGAMSAIYQRQYIESAQRFEAAPRLDAHWHEALDLLDALANDPALNFLMTLQRGDIQLVHNHTLLHDRTAFEDWPEPQRQRHLLRLWLAPDDARPLPAVFAQRFGSVVPGVRGGVGAARPAAPA